MILKEVNICITFVERITSSK